MNKRDEELVENLSKLYDNPRDITDDGTFMSNNSVVQQHKDALRGLKFKYILAFVLFVVSCVAFFILGQISERENTVDYRDANFFGIAFYILQVAVLALVPFLLCKEAIIYAEKYKIYKSKIEAHNNAVISSIEVVEYTDKQSRRRHFQRPKSKD